MRGGHILQLAAGKMGKLFIRIQTARLHRFGAERRGGDITVAVRGADKNVILARMERDGPYFLAGSRAWSSR